MTERTTSWTTGGRIAVNGEDPDDWGEDAPVTNPTTPATPEPDALVPPLRMIQTLRMPTQAEALVQIAEANGGVLRSVEAKRLLVVSGLIRGNAKNSTGHIFNLLRDAERFEKLGVRFERVSPGTYQLISLGVSP